MWAKGIILSWWAVFQLTATREQPFTYEIVVEERHIPCIPGEFYGLEN